PDRDADRRALAAALRRRLGVRERLDLDDVARPLRVYLTGDEGHAPCPGEEEAHREASPHADRGTRRLELCEGTVLGRSQQPHAAGGGERVRVRDRLGPAVDRRPLGVTYGSRASHRRAQARRKARTARTLRWSSAVALSPSFEKMLVTCFSTA